MILQSLAALAQREGLDKKPGLQRRPVDWLIDIDYDGAVQRISAYGDSNTKKRATLEVPTRLVRSSGVKPQILVDKSDYILGANDSVSPKSSDKAREAARVRLAQCMDAALEVYQRIVDETGSAAVRAQVQAMTSWRAQPALFFDRWIKGDKIKQVLASDGNFYDVPLTWKNNHMFAFQIKSNLVWLDPAVENWCHENILSFYETDTEARCLVSGRMCRPVNPHFAFDFPGDTGQLPMVSFNQDAFNHYGCKGNENASLSVETSYAVAESLNFLQRWEGEKQPQAVRLNDNTLALYWTDAKKQRRIFAGAIDEGKEAQIAKAREILSKARWKGHGDDFSEKLERLYTLIMSREKARMVIRSARLDRLRDVADNVLNFFDELEMVPPLGHEQRSYRGIYNLRDGLYPYQKGGKRLREPPADILNRLWNCALHGGDYPSFLLGELLRNGRLPAERRTRSHSAMALLKAILQRNYGDDAALKTKEITMSINEEHPHQAYHEGRLFALLQEIQRLAMGGKLNATIGDRFLGNAMVSPRQVFPGLLKLKFHHVSKGGTHAGALWNRDKELHAVLDRIPENFSDVLNLPEQGLFMLGYHHQRASWLLKKDADATPEKENETPVSKGEE